MMVMVVGSLGWCEARHANLFPRLLIYLGSGSVHVKKGFQNVTSLYFLQGGGCVCEVV